jgi:hypothetical protein
MEIKVISTVPLASKLLVSLVVLRTGVGLKERACGICRTGRLRIRNITTAVSVIVLAVSDGGSLADQLWRHVSFLVSVVVSTES